MQKKEKKKQSLADNFPPGVQLGESSKQPSLSLSLLPTFYMHRKKLKLPKQHTTTNVQNRVKMVETTHTLYSETSSLRKCQDKTMYISFDDAEVEKSRYTEVCLITK